MTDIRPQQITVSVQGVDLTDVDYTNIEQRIAEHMAERAAQEVDNQMLYGMTGRRITGDVYTYGNFEKYISPRIIPEVRKLRE